MNSVDTFSPWFENWIVRVPNLPTTRFRVLLILHSEFLTYSCQQMLRRSLEQRSFKCRVWFHIEEPMLQAAILSRCIVKTLPMYRHLPQIIGPPLDVSLWKDPRVYETNLLAAKE